MWLEHINIVNPILNFNPLQYCHFWYSNQASRSSSCCKNKKLTFLFPVPNLEPTISARSPESVSRKLCFKSTLSLINTMIGLLLFLDVFRGQSKKMCLLLMEKKIWLKFFLLFLTDLKSQGFYLISWVFIYISKVKMQDYKMALIVEFYDTYYLLTQKSEWSYTIG